MLRRQPLPRPSGRCPLGQPIRHSRRRRAGVTAMEYLFMLSLIIVAVILAVQHIGGLTSQKLSAAASKTAPAPGKGG